MQYQLLSDASSTTQLTKLINCAYRGVNGAKRWTTEHHLVEGARINEAALTQLIESPNTEMIVGRNGKDILSCIALKYEPGLVEFGSFAVNPAYHGEGYGSALLAFAEQHSGNRVATFKVSVVNYNQALIEFYQRRGYLHDGAYMDYPVADNVGIPRVDNLRLVVLQKHHGANHV